MTMIFAHRFCRGERMQYLQRQIWPTMGILGNSIVITVEHNPELLGDITTLSNEWSVMSNILHFFLLNFQTLDITLLLEL